MLNRSKSRTLSLSLLLIVALICGHSTKATSADRPNVLLVITDDQGYGDIGFHGNDEISTPTIDALARSSLRLTNFHVDPTCAETRAALMTGQFPLRNGVWHTIMGRSILRKSAVTLPQLFKDTGYRTGLFGKWHLGDNYPYRPQDRGFDRTLHLGGGGITQLPDVWGNDYFDDVYWANEQLQPAHGYCTDVFFGAAQEFIQADSKQPFFCYVATNAPHSPYNVPDSYKQPYINKGIEEPRANFYGMITNIDDNLARLLAVLEQTGQAENTIVMFMTDNGTAAGYTPAKQGKPAAGFNAGMRAQKGSQYDGGHRTPCFIRYPRELPVDRDFDRLCAHVDLLPTLSRLCQLDTSALALDGRDLVDFVSESKQWPERTLIVQSHRVEEPVPWRKSAVMTDRWRLIDGQELYDMQSDPAQKQPLEGLQYLAVVAELRAAYEKWWADMAVDPSQYSSIVLGSPAAERVRLTGHDWHGPQPTVMQSVIAQDPVTEGYWAVEVERAGTYQFLLSRRPLDQPGPVGCKRARLEIGNAKVEVATHPDSVLVPITIRLEPGATRLHTQFIDDGGAITSAYFVTVNYLGDVPQTVIDQGSTGLPEWIRPGDRIALLGGTLLERAAYSGALETEMLLRAPLAGLTFVNLAENADSFGGRVRAPGETIEDRKRRRLNNLQLSGASVVVIAYGINELLEGDSSDDRLQVYDTELRELITAVQSQSQRVVVCLPPQLNDDLEAPAARQLSREAHNAYEEHRGPLRTMVERTAKEFELTAIELPPLRTSMFESATYLSEDGYRSWCQDTADALLTSAANVGNSVRSRKEERSSKEKLYRLSSESNLMLVRMIKPHYQTDLPVIKPAHLNNALERSQLRPLIADKQLELLAAAARLAAHQ